MRVKGLNAGTDSLSDIKQDARQRGLRGETFACWYLRRHGYVFVARNYVPRDATGEIDLIGYDREALVL
jgi:Holliday junction resolvase-like predicted endonuclease